MAEADFLLIDVGNSRIKWAVVVDSTLSVGEPFAYRAESLKPLLMRNWTEVARPRAVCISNVAGADVAAELTAWVIQRWGLQPRFAAAQRGALGAVTRYEPPEKLGADRWLALLAARSYISGSGCVVDCGTALTLDVLDRDGVHLGGLIAPGLRLMRNSLAQRVPGLVVPEAPTADLFGVNTAEGIWCGSLQAALGLVERTVTDVAGMLGEAPEVLLTGGDSDLLADALRVPCRRLPHLVLEGLLLFAESNP